MDADEGIDRLVFHAQPRSGSFLDMLRLFRGLRSEILADVNEALRAAAPRLSEEQVPRTLMSAIWSMSYLAKSWALSPNGMLRRNHLINEAEQATLSQFLEAFDYAVLMLLDGATQEEAFPPRAE